MISTKPGGRGGARRHLVDLTGLNTVNALGGIAPATADLRVDFQRPARSGPLRAIGIAVKLGRQLSVADARIQASDKRYSRAAGVLTSADWTILGGQARVSIHDETN
ncbi:MAG: hotdog fold thioesterase [Croceibacterium sp.]|jgi:uncharacterized protein (TIGR00369 family)